MFAESVRTRTTTSTVVFRNAFRFEQDRRELPPGTYVIHTHEDVYEGAFEPLYLATCVELVVRETGRSISRVVPPSDFNAALARDGLVDGLSENPDRGRAV